MSGERRGAVAVDSTGQVSPPALHVQQYLQKMSESLRSLGRPESKANHIVIALLMFTLFVTSNDSK